MSETSVGASRLQLEILNVLLEGLAMMLSQNVLGIFDWSPRFPVLPPPPFCTHLPAWATTQFGTKILSTPGSNSSLPNPQELPNFPSLSLSAFVEFGRCSVTQGQDIFVSTTGVGP